MEIVSLIGIIGISIMTISYLTHLRKLNQRERELLLRSRRSREIMKRIEEAEGKIQWN